MATLHRDSWEQYVVIVEKEIAELKAENERLRAGLEGAYRDNLYNALHAGVTGNGGKWWPGGMSDAEWFCRQAGISPSPEFTKDDLLNRVPEIAERMVKDLFRTGT